MNKSRKKKTPEQIILGLEIKAASRKRYADKFVNTKIHK